MSCSRLYNEYDGVQHDYTRKGGLVWQQIFLPDHAPPEWQDREQLWNAVEAAEKTKDSRLAREFVVALPVELNKDAWVDLLSEFIRAQFVSEGMCADAAIHDTDGHNPHAHILLTVRPLNPDGTWAYKTEKEYLCVRGGEEQGFTAPEFLKAQGHGWEKQYPYRVGRKKVYLPPSKAELHGYERISKYPKSTKYGRQNPITAKWNSEEQLIAWRKAWADAVNHALELAGKDERIDHRSHAERGLEERPTIHEGVTARKIERAGYISDRGEINREIRAENALMRELKAVVKKLAKDVMDTVPALAKAMESLRGNLIVLHYGLFQTQERRSRAGRFLSAAKPAYENYEALREQLKEKASQRHDLSAELKATPLLNLVRRSQLKSQIAGLTEESEELKSEQNRILEDFEKEDAAGMKEVHADIVSAERSVQQYNQQEERLQEEIQEAAQEFDSLSKQAESHDPDDLIQERLRIRPEFERQAKARIRQAHGENHPGFWDLESSIRETDELLGEASMAEDFQRREAQKEWEAEVPQRAPKRRTHDLER